MIEYTAADIPPALAKLAIDAQDACNLSGVVHAFSKAVNEVWDLAHARGQGTSWVNSHPVCVMLADKLAELSGRDLFSKSYDLCDKAIGSSAPLNSPAGGQCPVPR